MFACCRLGIEKIEGKIILLGDSVSDDGRFLSYIHTYLVLQQNIETPTFINLGVCSETISGLSETAHPFRRPCLSGRLQKAVELIRPDWVILCYGMNDGIYAPFAEERFCKFKKGMQDTIKYLHQAGCKIIVMTPPPFDKVTFGQPLAKIEAADFSYLLPYEEYDSVLQKYVDWITGELSEKVELIINIYQELKGKALTIDGIHPDLRGHLAIGREMLNTMFHIFPEEFDKHIAVEDSDLFNLVLKRDMLSHRYEKERVGHDNPNKEEFLTEENFLTLSAVYEEEIETYLREHQEVRERQSSWNGYKRYDFFFAGHEAIIIEPAQRNETGKWLWRMEFFDAYPMADAAMLEKGYRLVYLNMKNMYGNSDAIQLMQVFYTYVVQKYGLRERACLLGFSRGGLYAVHYAVNYPDTVSALYLDAPVIDIRSWPAGKYEGNGSPKEWEECKLLYCITDEDMSGYDTILTEQCNQLAKTGIPLIMVAGDADEEVPYIENGDRLVKAYRAVGGNAKEIIKKGVGHHPHSLENPEPITNFLLINEISGKQ